MVHGCRQLVVRCWVKSRNERNPVARVASIQLGTRETAGVEAEGRWGRRQVIMPLMPWAAHATMAGTTGCDAAARRS